MRTVVVQVSASGQNGQAIPLNQYADGPFSVGFGVVKGGTGDITYSVQHTFDDPQRDSSLTWFDHSFVSGQTASKDGNYAFPVQAVRLVCVSASGSVTATITVIQNGY